MTTITVALIWAALAALFLARLDRWAHRWLDLKDSAKRMPEQVEIPDDLVGFALEYSDKWAQDQTLSAIREKYESLHDWNKVRHALGVAERAVEVSA